jgi:hypothetical protein
MQRDFGLRDRQCVSKRHIRRNVAMECAWFLRCMYRTQVSLTEDFSFYYISANVVSVSEHEPPPHLVRFLSTYYLYCTSSVPH